MRVVTRPEFPNRHSFVTILVLTSARMALGCGCFVSEAAGGNGGARQVELSRTQSVLGCRSDWMSGIILLYL
ncbi:hypothetical protein EJ02DRAFT_75587 [Clathrospora elynae]|uniref:Secreted protein n=1 Tax=Clathrospora elynae TaxID=706981 RepID=A0A6A5SAB4_9PLEO|nr:hypothetical protein EJ02DRAFT_75587 [Clathrospora elynae]